MPSIKFKCPNPECDEMHSIWIAEENLPCKVSASEKDELYVPVEAPVIALSNSPLKDNQA